MADCHIMRVMGGRSFAEKSRSSFAQRELARARRIAEALTSAGDRDIVEAYIRELSIRAAMTPDSKPPVLDQL